MLDTKPLRILIAGAGIAGPALALCLQRLGHSITIIERWQTLRVGGQQVDIRRQGIEAARRMGILEDIRQHVVDEAGLDFVNEKDQSIIFFPRHEPGSKNQGFSSEFEIMRGDLCRLLYDKTQEKVKYRFGLSVNSFENVGDIVKVTLSDGTMEEYDLLVGADGQGSRVRRAMNKDEGGDEQFLRSTGGLIGYYAIKRTANDEDHATVYIETGQRLVLTRWHSPNLGQAYLTAKKGSANGEKIKDSLSQDVATQKAAFKEVFKSVRWSKMDRVLDAIDMTEDFYAHEIIQVRGSKWSKGRVVLLGDAGYCPSTFTGMGTSVALVGAYILAGEIAKSKGNVDAALAGYNATLRPYIDKAQVLSTALDWVVPKSMVGLKIMHLVLGLANKLNVQKLLQNRTTEVKDDWEMPWYEELHVLEQGVSA